MGKQTSALCWTPRMLLWKEVRPERPVGVNRRRWCVAVAVTLINANAHILTTLHYTLRYFQKLLQIDAGACILNCVVFYAILILQPVWHYFWINHRMKLFLASANNQECSLFQRHLIFSGVFFSYLDLTKYYFCVGNTKTIYSKICQNISFLNKYKDLKNIFIHFVCIC